MKIRHFVLILLAAFLCMMALEFVFGFHPVPMGVDRWCARKEWMPTDRYNALPCTCERRTGERREPWTPDQTREWERSTTDRRSPEGERK